MTKKTQAAPASAPSCATQNNGNHARKGPRGLGAMRHIPLNIDPRIDLTKPIYEQVLALEKADKEAAEAGE